MPLLLIILLENAFKHGVENLIEKAFIHLSVKAHDEQVKFEIENNFDDKEVSKESGIGISNLKRRLNLVYPKKHNLSFSQANSIYHAQLEIQL
jgi:LytS/YehU family sensor histidine kinase